MIELKAEGFHLPTSNALIRGHWTAYKRLKDSLAMILMTQVRDLPKAVKAQLPLKRARIIYTRLGTQRMDPDNMAGSIKPLLDLLRPLKHTSGVYASGVKKGKAWSRTQGQFGIIAGDTTQEIELECRWEKASKPGFRITIIPLEDP